MKEVLTKSFWQGVKKTFYEAMEDAPAKKDASQPPAAQPGSPSSPQESSSPSPQTEEKLKQ
jgi:hypothetical protein